VSAGSALCTVTYGLGTPEGTCNENQFSQPFVGPDGTLYVVYNNFNNPEAAGNTSANNNQILMAESLDGGNTFSPPVLVSKYYELPDCLTYQNDDPGRACVPEKGPTQSSVFRATNYAVGEVNPRDPNQVVVTFGSYINRHSNEANGCVPAGFNPATGQNLYTGVKPGPCNNDILVSVSQNHGATFTGTTTDPRALPSATTDPAQAVSDQFWQWASFTKQGKFAVSYYDRQYGPSVRVGSERYQFDEATG